MRNEGEYNVMMVLKKAANIDIWVCEIEKNTTLV